MILSFPGIPKLSLISLVRKYLFHITSKNTRKMQVMLHLLSGT
jgi:hypothetical protein